MKTTPFLLIILFVLNSSPDLEGKIRPTFYLRNKGATMPVIIRGNLTSNVLIVFLHGGPGGTALKKIGTRAFNELERDFGVVYWDQRGADKSKGGVKKELLKLDQFVEDLDELIERLTVMHPNASVFLMGHCWGGALGTAYLLDPIRQSKITGWIDVAGAHNNPRGDSLSGEWVKQHARRMIAADHDTRYWKKALGWYAKNPSFNSDQLNHYTYVRKALGYQRIEGDSLGMFPCYTKKDMVMHPFEYISYYVRYYRTLSKFIISDIDLTSQMHNITLPALIMWGKEDGLIPVALATEAYQALGTSEVDKKLVVLDHTAHTIHYEQPTRFFNEVKGFIEKYRKRDASRYWMMASNRHP